MEHGDLSYFSIRLKKKNNTAIENGTFIVDLPIKNDNFLQPMSVYQRLYLA